MKQHTEEVSGQVGAVALHLLLKRQEFDIEKLEARVEALEKKQSDPEITDPELLKLVDDIVTSSRANADIVPN